MPTGAFEVSKVRNALADRYKILRVLGEGGMATVYLAEDLKHKREVAVKVMRPELSETLGAERFLREVEIAAKLSHPNILPVYDSGTAQGVLYYVMPVVEGESLPARIKREKQLPVEEALRLAREVAEAMAYAHARGFVHRDIKPANILISAGHALVADFGIARAMEGDGQSITQTGLAIGTPQYMSPEQASGATDLDGRSDIYALGCVLYEMIAGEPPFTGPTVQAVIMRSMTEAPRPLEQTRTSLPPAVGAVVTRALAKAPADRYANAGAMVTALVAAERDTQSGFVTASTSARSGVKPWQLGLAAAAVLALGAVGMKVMGGATGGTPTAAVAKSVAVLPFAHQGTDDEAYFAEGIVDELRVRLARLDQMIVTASASANQYRETTKTAPEIAKELRVDQVLMGGVRWVTGPAGTRQVRVTAELVDGKTGKVTWSDNFDADAADPFAIQGRIAIRVATALGKVLGERESADLAGRPTQNALAYDLFLKAQATTGNTNAQNRMAVSLLEQAVALDSTFARAWGLLSINLSALYADATRDPVVARRAKEALDRTLRLANDSAWAHRAASIYYRGVAGDEPAARQAVDRSLALDPNDPRALNSSAVIDRGAGRYREMFEKLSRARAIDPRDPVIVANLLRAQIALGQTDEAAATAEELLALEPTVLDHIQWAAMAHLARNDTASARRVVREQLERIAPTDLVTQFAGYLEAAFLLDQRELDLLFRLTPAAFDDDRAWWGQSLATAAWQRGDMRRARAYADSALAESKRQSDANPEDAQLRVLYAVVLAYLGREADALREAERAIQDVEGSTFDNKHYVNLQAIRVHLTLGNADRGMDLLEEAVESRGPYVTRGYLKTDPVFRSLDGNPRFERLKVGGIDAPKN
jgi:serine/threonine-protein kinase